MYRMLIKEDLSHYDLSSVKHATIAGEALNPEVFPPDGEVHRNAAHGRDSVRAKPRS